MIMFFAGATLLEKIFFQDLLVSLDAGMASVVTNFVMEGDNICWNKTSFCW
jgi:hypothetical protein